MPSTGCTQVNCTHIIVKFCIHNVFSCFCLGKDHSQTPSKYGVTHGIVMQVTKSLQGMGHHLYMDNFYTSPAMFYSLQKLAFTLAEFYGATELVFQLR